MNKICISNLVYGQSYTDIFLNFHLKSLLENLDGNNFINSYYFIFTEETNIKTIESHNNYQKLKDKLIVNFIKLEGGEITYESRNHLRTIQYQWSAKFAIENDLLLHVTYANTYYGIDFLKKATEYINLGYDAVINSPMIVVFESVSNFLTQREMLVDDLFNISITNLHPIWKSSNWESPNFTKLPYKIIWSDEKSLCIRAFAHTPILVIPKEWMITLSGPIDTSFLPYFKKPYYAENWSELPWIELKMLQTSYLTENSNKFNIHNIATWAKQNVQIDNYSNLSRHVVYKKTTDQINQNLISNSKLITDVLITTLIFQGM